MVRSRPRPRPAMRECAECGSSSRKTKKKKNMPEKGGKVDLRLNRELELHGLVQAAASRGELRSARSQEARASKSQASQGRESRETTKTSWIRVSVARTTTGSSAICSFRRTTFVHPRLRLSQSDGRVQGLSLVPRKLKLSGVRASTVRDGKLS